MNLESAFHYPPMDETGCQKRELRTPRCWQSTLDSPQLPKSPFQLLFGQN